MKKYLLVLFFAVFITSSFAEEGSWTGFIGDSKCGVKGNNEDHAACAAKCIKGGASPVLVVGDKVYKIENPEKVTDYVGKKVTIQGDLTGDTIRISKIGA